MNKDIIKSILKKSLNAEKIYIKSENDEKHLQIIIISKLFEEKNSLKRHQMVYHPLMNYISNNMIHAISIKTYTPLEWLSDKKTSIS